MLLSVAMPLRPSQGSARTLGLAWDRARADGGLVTSYVGHPNSPSRRPDARSPPNAISENLRRKIPNEELLIDSRTCRQGMQV